MSRAIHLVPPFNEKDLDGYFRHFEKVAGSLNWPKEYWSTLLQSVIKGKAQQVYTALSEQQSTQYDVVKASILRAYDLIPEAYRKKFRILRKADGQTNVEFAREKEMCFDKWCSSQNVTEFEKLRQLMLLEEFKNCMRDEVKTYLCEREVETLEEAAKLADIYEVTHKKTVVNKPLFKYHERRNRTESRRENYGSVEHNKDDKSSRLTCGYCKKPGHIMADCFILKRKKEREGSNPAPEAFICHTTRNSSSYKEFLDRTFTCKDKEETPCKEIIPCKSDRDLMENFLPFITEGYVSEGIDSPQVPIKILRDTGASQSLLLKGIIDRKEHDSYSLIQGIQDKNISVPLCNLYLKSPLVTGHVQVGLMAQLPIKGISLLLGNDLAGEQVVPNLDLMSNPVTEDYDMNKEIYASCVVTGSMTKETREENVERSTNKYHDQGHEMTELYGINISDLFKEESYDQSSDTKVGYETGASKIPLSKVELITVQKDDEDISHLRDPVVNISDDLSIMIDLEQNSCKKIGFESVDSNLSLSKVGLITERSQDVDVTLLRDSFLNMSDDLSTMTDLDQNLNVKVGKKNAGDALLLKEQHISNLVNDVDCSHLRDVILGNTSLENNRIKCEIQHQVMFGEQVQFDLNSERLLLVKKAGHDVIVSDNSKSDISVCDAVHNVVPDGSFEENVMIDYDIDGLPLTRKRVTRERSYVKFFPLRDETLMKSEMRGMSVGYHLRSEILMGTWQPPDIFKNVDWITHDI